MGVGGNFWDILKPYCRTEGFDFLRNKRVAVDLSYWIVQHETAIKSHTRNPHLRLTFFRTINLISKFGAFPVFVVDGAPSPLKSRARILRFFRASGIDVVDLPVAEEGVSVERNQAFTKYVRECVELLELLGMPVLKAGGEAEALCAQLNREGHVDACITADSDAFLFGAECVIKHIRPNSKEPLDCYSMSDIEAGLGLKREHLIAISLLVGNDYDLGGVQGIGVDTALRFVKSYSKDEILNRLHEIGSGDALQFQGGIKTIGCTTPTSDEKLKKAKTSHCSLCGHPGSKRAHLTSPCEYCSSSSSTACMRKPVGFKCNCLSCDLDRKEKEQKKNENWQINVCKKIAMEHNFPNREIVDMYLSTNQGNFNDDGPHISWESPKTEMLVDYLAYHQHWEPSYIRQRLLPMLSTLFLREMASNPTNDLLHGQYEFDSIQRVKVKFGHQFYVVNWKKAGNAVYMVPSQESNVQREPDQTVDVIDLSDEPDVPQVHVGNAIYMVPSQESSVQIDPDQTVEVIDLSDEPDVPQVHVADGCSFLSTDEDMELVKAAFPEKVDEFLQEKERKEMKSRKKKSSLMSERTPESSKLPTPTGVQLSIKEFYRSSKALHREKQADDLAEKPENSNDSPKRKRNVSTPNLSKSARRRLLFG